MKHIIPILTFIAASLFCSGISAQTAVPEGYELADSVVYIAVSPVDTTLSGKNIFDIMPQKDRWNDGGVNINQSSLISRSMGTHIKSNGNRSLNGYRVRIFFDNKQSARNESEMTLKRFRSRYPEIKAYRIYANPYFKVTVGDFRTKTEAMALLTRIKGEFPGSFVVKENIEYPVIDTDNAVITDTIKVLRPIIQQ